MIIIIMWADEVVNAKKRNWNNFPPTHQYCDTLNWWHKLLLMKISNLTSQWFIWLQMEIANEWHNYILKNPIEKWDIGLDWDILKKNPGSLEQGRFLRKKYINFQTLNFLMKIWSKILFSIYIEKNRTDGHHRPNH